MRAAIERASKLRSAIGERFSNHGFRIDVLNSTDSEFRHILEDPTKISVNLGNLLPSRQAQDYIFAKHGIYLSRVTDSSILLNFHIGVDDNGLEQLLNALDALVQHNSSAADEISGRLVIPYRCNI